jgi:hypothetical protein
MDNKLQEVINKIKEIEGYDIEVTENYNVDNYSSYYNNTNSVTISFKIS